MLGTVISMVDFLNHLPFPETFLGGAKMRNLAFHLLSGGLCYILCLIRDTKYVMMIDNWNYYNL